MNTKGAVNILITSKLHLTLNPYNCIFFQLDNVIVTEEIHHITLRDFNTKRKII